jgi:hypothetical protein
MATMALDLPHGRFASGASNWDPRRGDSALYPRNAIDPIEHSRTLLGGPTDVHEIWRNGSFGRGRKRFYEVKVSLKVQCSAGCPLCSALVPSSIPGFDPPAVRCYNVCTCRGSEFVSFARTPASGSGVRMLGNGSRSPGVGRSLRFLVLPPREEVSPRCGRRDG